jgi:hypothetical protein
MPKKPNTRDWQAVEREGALNEGRVLAYERLMDADLEILAKRERVPGHVTLADHVDGDDLSQEEDLYFATLARWVASLGGHIEVRAVFPEQTVTVLTMPDPESS